MNVKIKNRELRCRLRDCAHRSTSTDLHPVNVISIAWQAECGIRLHVYCLFYFKLAQSGTALFILELKVSKGDFQPLKIFIQDATYFHGKLHLGPYFSPL